MEFINFEENITSVINLVSLGSETMAVTEDESSFMEEVKTYTEFKIANFINM